MTEEVHIFIDEICLKHTMNIELSSYEKINLIMADPIAKRLIEVYLKDVKLDPNKIL